MPVSDRAIRTEGLTRAFGNRVAVDHLDLEVRRGEIFGLLGPNGAGKTTTVGMLTTRVVPTSGKAFVGGIDVAHDPVRVKQLIGVVNENNTLDRKLTAWENLYFHGHYFGLGAKAARAAADEWLEAFRLADRAKSDVATLSRGMAQRLMMARGTLHRPAVLFLDEPTGGLDPQSRLALWEILGKLHADGQTILLTTHQMEEAEKLCDRVAIMDGGRILAVDSPAALRRAHGGITVVVKGEGSYARLLDRLAPSGLDKGAEQIDGVLRLQVESAEGLLARVVAAAEQADFALTDISVNEPTLETVFLSLTGKQLRD